jgi:hypothetical protein
MCVRSEEDECFVCEVECGASVKKVQPASKRKQGTNIVTGLESQATPHSVRLQHINTTSLNHIARSALAHNPLTAKPRHIIPHRKTPAVHSAALI